MAVPLLKRQPVSASSSAGLPAPAPPPEVSVAATVPPASEADEAAAVPSTATPVTAMPVTVQLEALDRVWVTASADAQRTFYGTMQAGERQTLRGDREIMILVGNAGLVRWQVNGRPEAVMGPRGAVQSVRVTPGGAEVQPTPPRPKRPKVKRRR
jgi:hypothetical protein